MTESKEGNDLIFVENIEQEPKDEIKNARQAIVSLEVETGSIGGKNKDLKPH